MKKACLLVLSFCFMFLSAVPSYSAANTKSKSVEVKAAVGKIRGKSTNGVNVFKGIPFAKPPVGDLRFAPPQDIEPWKNVFNAAEFGDMPVQPVALEGKPMSEDCLNLNIWTPAKATKKSKLPVYVFIYGGAWSAGSNSLKLYDGTNLAKNGIIVVTINYRLGTLGYFASSETFNLYGTTGNWGTLDQIKALQWVNKNIEAFGGDAKNITIGGESAGSFSVSALMLSPLAEGLFQKAIMESGDIASAQFDNPYSRSEMKRAITLNNAISYVFDVEDNAEGLKALRAADPNVLCQLTEFETNFLKSPLFFTIPVYDGYVIPLNPAKALKDGKFHKVKVLCGFNEDEGSNFISAATPLNYETFVYKMFGAKNAPTILERFPVDNENTALERTRQALKYGMFAAGTKRTADIYSANNLDVYMYNFTYATEKTKKANLGAHHGMELDYIFGNFREEEVSQKDKQLSKEMQTRFVNFIKTGDPNKGIALPSTALWPKYNEQEAKVMNFGETVEAVTIPAKEDINFMMERMFGE
jgi:para-nitrobenzyl esterase